MSHFIYYNKYNNVLFWRDMKSIEIKIKKELTEDEFKDLIIVCEQKFEKINKIYDIALGCEEKTKEITPAQEAYVLLPKLESKEFEIITLGKNIAIDFNQESILSECYKTKQPLMINDVTRSFVYREKIDNFLNLDVKDLLLIPIVDDSSEKEVLAIIWATITGGSWNQYTQKDIDYMTRFSIFFKRFIQGKNIVSIEHKEDAGFLDCMDAYDTLSAKMRREQEYFSTIIHDVRTPMNAVMGFLELLSLKEVDKEKKEYLETALKSGETMVTLINDALDISKMASGKMNIEKVEFNPMEELSDVAKLFYNTARKKGIVLTTFYDPNIPKLIHSDFHRIKQIMNNLLSNAIKFTPEKGEISLDMRYDEERDGLTISVHDSGIGIAKEMQKNIFTPYTQEKSSTSREYGGTGLGLSIAQQLSVLLGGKLELMSKEGHGSRFYFTLPCNTSKDTPSSIDKDRFKTLSILLYNPQDTNVTINSIKPYLEYYNVELHLANEKKTLKSIEINRFDILVIFKDDAIKNDKYVQKILDSDKSVVILGDTFLQDGCHFLGNVLRLNSPLLPHDIHDTFIQLIEPETKISKDEVLSNELKKLKGKHILVVDDSTINLKFMKEVLKTVNLEAILSQSGVESVERFKNEEIDLIFMDENMPGIQGSEAISRIREIEKKNNLKRTVIIGLTGDTGNSVREYILHSGADDVLTKPVQLKEIMYRLTHYLGT